MKQQWDRDLAVYWQRGHGSICLLAALLLLSACEPSVEENLDRLSRGGAEAEEAKIALLVRFDGSWEPAVEAAAFVGEDFWSAECKIPNGQQGFPEVHPGDIWGFNFVRLFRGLDYSQWVVGFKDGSWYGDELGFIQFE